MRRTTFATMRNMSPKPPKRLLVQQKKRAASMRSCHAPRDPPHRPVSLYTTGTVM
jgi:hypothetical protein